MTRPSFCRRAAVLLWLSTVAGMAGTPPARPQAGTPVAPGTVALGGEVILRIRAAAGGLSPDQRVAAIMDRLQRVVGFPNIHPSDVVVYEPPAKALNQAPVVYALGRRLITVDAATAQAAGGGNALQLATAWAKRLQQVLPRVNWRPSNAPEPVIPADPPLRVTRDLAQVGGSVGDVRLHDKLVIRLRGPQSAGWTAAERADALTARLDHVAGTLAGSDPAVAVVARMPADPAGPVDLTVGGQTIVTVDAAQAKANGAATPASLAQSWVKNIRAVLGTVPAPPAGQENGGKGANTGYTKDRSP